MNKKLFVRLLCALLSVLTLVAIVPATAILAAAEDATQDSTTTTPVKEDENYTNKTYTKGEYASSEAYLKDMTLYYSNDTYELYCDESMGVVAYKNKLTQEVMFTNPWNINEGVSADDLSTWQSGLTEEKEEMLSQIVLKYTSSAGSDTLYSYTDAAKKGQISVVPIKNGLRVEYALGDLSPRILAPERIEKKTFETNILKPLREGLIADYGEEMGAWHYSKFIAYYRLINYTTEKRDVKREALERDYPVLAKKNIDMYMLGNDALASDSVKREQIEAKIKKYCKGYTLEMMDEDYDFLEYEREDVSPPVFKLALEYVIDAQGLSVTLPANGLRYDESVYRVSSLIVLPYMGASFATNGGYSFIADGSGTLYELDAQTQRPARVYGDDYALQDESSSGNITIKNHRVMRMPVYGQVEFAYTDKDGNAITKAQYKALSAEEQELCTQKNRGYFAIIEEGDSLASVITAQDPSVRRHSLIKVEFITRQKDSFEGGWSDYALRRYVENYKIRYIMLNDDQSAKQANLSSYYECSWMGMACAYRDYLDSLDNGFERLTAADVSDAGIPLYIETFGCMDTIEKKLSMPVTVSKELTTFEDIATMYDYLSGKGVKNVNFKLKGYANGGLYSDVPYKLKWESSVGGSKGFEELLEKAKTEGFGVYPDFDFVYTSRAEGGDQVNLKKHAARTIFNRYTTKRAYSSTYQSFVSYFQMVMAPATYAHFYEKLSTKYAKYGATGISLGTFGSSLNSDFDEEKTSLREESKEYIIQGLAHFKNQGYDVMVDAGNAFTWSYVDHILGVALDSSRYSAELTAVPFVGVVLHGYKQFASTPLNMEGNLSYAMLKAMESGASAYFILSYANTQLLKEDEVLSQNYSVRYDIWRKRLVEIYQELNNVLSDVQTKLIVKHEVLNLDAKSETLRVPDQEELLKDIEAIAQNQKQQIEQKLEAEDLAMLTAIRSARESVLKAPSVLDVALNENANANTKGAKVLKNSILAQLAYQNTTENPSELVKKWVRVITEETKVADLEAVVKNNVVKPYANVLRLLQSTEAAILSAKAGYDFLKANDVTGQVLAEAKATLMDSINKYVALLNVAESVGYSLTPAACEVWVNGSDTTIRSLKDKMTTANVAVVVAPEKLEGFIFGTTAMAEHNNIGVAELYDAIKAQLVADGYTNPDNAAKATINMDQMLKDEKVPAAATYAAITVAPVVMEKVELDTNKKYKVDNNVVAVTYGNDDGTPYKTLLLNFNDYTVQTKYNGRIYTIAAYDYVVIKY